MYVARTCNNRVIVVLDLYCCLLPQCEALHTCRSGFLTVTQLIQTVLCIQLIQTVLLADSCCAASERFLFEIYHTMS